MVQPKLTYDLAWLREKARGKDKKKEIGIYQEIQERSVIEKKGI